MIRSLALPLALAIFGFAAPARATAPVPVCRLPAVVEVMLQELRIDPNYTLIDPRLIAEVPTPDPLVVRCDVCLGITLYDTRRFGDSPVARCEVRIFSVRALRKGFVVTVLR